MSGNLPPEILDLILLHVAGFSDAVPWELQKDLARCVQVSRAWARAAGMFLSQSLSLCMPYRQYSDTWSEFVESVRRSPHGRRKVDTLSISDVFEDDDEDNLPIPEVDLSSLARLAMTLPRLECIELASVKLRVTTRQTPFPRFPATLEKFAFDTYGDGNEYTMTEFMDTLLRSLCRVETLELSNCVFIPDSQNRPSNIRLPYFPNLCTLVLRGNTGMVHILKDLASLARDGHARVLSEVSLGILSPNDIRKLSHFLVFMNVHLRILTLQLDFQNYHPLEYAVVKVACCPNLNRLCFIVDHDGVPRTSYAATWGYIARIFRGHELPALRMLTFEYTETASTEDYEERNVHLPRRAMIELEHVLLAMPGKVAFIPPEWDNDGAFGERDRSHIQRAFRRLDALNKLTFHASRM